MESDDWSDDNVRQDVDRAAIEHIAKRKLPTIWPVGAMRAGTRARVVQDERWNGPWAQVFTGTVSDMAASEAVSHRSARAGELSLWIEFDIPQMDGNGDGPYRKAQIWGRYLGPIR